MDVERNLLAAEAKQEQEQVQQVINHKQQVFLLRLHHYSFDSFNWQLSERLMELRSRGSDLSSTLEVARSQHERKVTLASHGVQLAETELRR